MAPVVVLEPLEMLNPTADLDESLMTSYQPCERSSWSEVYRSPCDVHIQTNPAEVSLCTHDGETCLNVNRRGEWGKGDRERGREISTPFASGAEYMCHEWSRTHAVRTVLCHVDAEVLDVDLIGDLQSLTFSSA